MPKGGLHSPTVARNGRCLLRESRRFSSGEAGDHELPGSDAIYLSNMTAN